MTGPVPEGEAPVFLHSSFRTSSTWLWSKLRAEPRNLAFYEVFNEGLATIRLEDIPNIHGGTWPSRHPPAAPYFIEFAPLIAPAGGVRGYAPAMAGARFIPPDGVGGRLPEDEAAYLRLLIGHARGLRRRPVLTATRSLGRISAIRTAVGGTHLFVFRNLFRQWCSYAEQYHQGNPYFINSVDRLLQASRHDAFLAGVARDHPPAADPAPDARLFYAFALMHLYLYAHAAMQADLRIDADRLAADADYRRHTEAEVGDRLGQPLDLSDAQASIGFIIEPLPPDGEIASVLADGIVGIRHAIPDLPLSAGAFLQALADDLVAEHERWRFYAGRLKAHFLDSGQDGSS